MLVGNVIFTNGTGGTAQIFWNTGMQGHHTMVQPNQSSSQINGNLLTIDVIRAGGQRYSYDFTQNNGLLVQAESPYSLSQIIGPNQVLMLVIRDRFGNIAVEVWPS